MRCEFSVWINVHGIRPSLGRRRPDAINIRVIKLDPAGAADVTKSTLVEAVLTVDWIARQCAAALLNLILSLVPLGCLLFNHLTYVSGILTCSTLEETTGEVYHNIFHVCPGCMIGALYQGHPVSH